MKLFVFSDAHGFTDVLVEELGKKGFEPNNPEHLLIGCGDFFDRGNQPKEMIEFLNSIPNKVLIKGNHEILIDECIQREHVLWHDWHNGTGDTIATFADDDEYNHESYEKAAEVFYPFAEQLVNYFETEHYIFVHSWIPGADWRKASEFKWGKASWMNPMDAAEWRSSEDFDNKVIVSGHWHCSDGWHRLKGTSEFGEDAVWEPCRYTDHLIMIDRCTAHTNQINVLILEDELLDSKA